MKYKESHGTKHGVYLKKKIMKVSAFQRKIV